MNFALPTSTQFTVSVWNATTRKLTSMGGAMSITAVSNTTLAASGTFTIVPAINTIAYCTIGVKSGAASPTNIFLFDGTNNYIAGSIAANTTGVLNLMLAGVANSVKVVNADGTNAATYAYNEHVIQLT